MGLQGSIWNIIQKPIDDVSHSLRGHLLMSANTWELQWGTSEKLDSGKIYGLGCSSKRKVPYCIFSFYERRIKPYCITRSDLAWICFSIFHSRRALRPLEIQSWRKTGTLWTAAKMQLHPQIHIKTLSSMADENVIFVTQTCNSIGPSWCRCNDRGPLV